MQTNPAAGIYGSFEFDIRAAIANISVAANELNKLTNTTKAAEKASREKANAVKEAERAAVKASKEEAKAARDAEIAMKRAEAEARKYNDALNKHAASTNKSALATGIFSRELSALSGAIAGMTVMAAAGQMLKFATDIEDGFVGVRRTTGVAGEAFKSLRKDILQLSGDLRGMDTRAIQDIATIAGQLGLAVKDIPAFTETVAKAAFAVDMSADSTANFLARIGMNMKVPVDQFIKIANTANQLGNTTTATAAEILEIAQRMSGTANVFGISPQEMLAIATASRQAGVEIEVAGTAWTQIMSRMLTDTKRFAHVAGVSLKDFTDLLKNDPIKAIEAFAAGLTKLDKFGQVKALDDLQLDGARVGQVVMKLAGNMDSFHDILQNANEEWANGSSVEREYVAASETVSASMKQLWNSMKLLADSMAGDLLPSLAGMTNELSATVRYLAGYGETLEAAVKRQKDLADSTDELYKSFEELAGKQNRSAEEQTQLNDLADQLRAILPDLTVMYNEHGDVIGVNAEKYRELAAAQRESAKAAADALKADTQLQHANTVKSVSILEQYMEWSKSKNPNEVIQRPGVLPDGVADFISQKKGTLGALTEISSGEYTYGKLTADIEAGINEYKRKREEIYKQLTDANKPAPKPYATGTGEAGDRQQVELDRRKALLAAKSKEDRIAIEKKYYADITALSEKQLAHDLSLLKGKKDAETQAVALKKQHSIELQRIEIDQAEALKSIEGKDYIPLGGGGGSGGSGGKEHYDPIKSSLDIEKQQIDLDRRKALSTAKSADERISIEKKYYADATSLSERQLAHEIALLKGQDDADAQAVALKGQHSVELQRIELDQSAAIKAIQEKSIEETGRDQEQSFRSMLDLEKQQADLDRRKALSSAQSAEERLAIEQKYYAAIQKLVEDQFAHDSKMVEGETGSQEKIKNLEKQLNLDLENLAQDRYDTERDIRERAQQEELKDVEKQNHELEKKMYERERTFRRVFEPLIRGENFGDFIKDLMMDDLMDALAKNMSVSLPFGNGSGGIFGSLFSGLGSLFGGLTSGSSGLTSAGTYQVNRPVIESTPITMAQKSDTATSWTQPIDAIDDSLMLPSIELPDSDISSDLPITREASQSRIDSGWDEIPEIVNQEPESFSPMTQEPIAPRFELPDFSVQEPIAPRFELPKFEIPTIKTPKLEIQEFQMQKESAPKFELPSLKDSSSGLSNLAKSAPAQNSTNIEMNINTGGAPFDMAAANSLKQTVKQVVEKTMADDRRRFGKISQSQARY